MGKRVNKTFTEEVYAAVRRIPVGRVATYGQIAAMIGRPNAARAVGNALHRNPDSAVTPCHRVVNSRGELACNFAFDGAEEQRVRLMAEGVEVEGGRVDLSKYGLGVE